MSDVRMHPVQDLWHGDQERGMRRVRQAIRKMHLQEKEMTDSPVVSRRRVKVAFFTLRIAVDPYQVSANQYLGPAFSVIMGNRNISGTVISR